MPNPKRSDNGSRNIHCSRYEQCLDLAADRYWPGWTCAECQFKDVREERYEDYRGYWNLLVEVFRQSKGKSERRAYRSLVF